ncbi:MAG TPA: MOSC domain-containing protein [Nocardioidaceae bacterium]|nr:MOSC domain-containing protein [Nocardioidaceae bacterium]
MRAPCPEATGLVPGGHIASVNLSAVHDFSKRPALEAKLIAGVGVEGDAHAGATVRHRYARRKSPDQPNRRQVHLIATELLDELARGGHLVAPGDLGENITTTGVDLLNLPSGTVLRLGEQAEVELTGLRTPCRLIDDFQAGLMSQMWGVDAEGRRFRKAGVMGVVVTGGVVRAGDPLNVGLPDEPRKPLSPV